MLSIACGIFLIDKNNRLLIVHPTNHPDNMWSIPKGIKNINDYDEFTAAKRELLEETSIDIESSSDNCRIHYLGIVTYSRLRKKKLMGFACKLDCEIRQKLKCESYVNSGCNGFFMLQGALQRGGMESSFPEVDRFKWATFDEAMRLIPLTQKKLLRVYLKKDAGYREKDSVGNYEIAGCGAA